MIKELGYCTEVTRD